MSILSKKKIIGITGSIGAGKSKVAAYLRQTYPVLDCDKVNAQLLKKGNEGYKALRFLGWVPTLENQEIDKKGMAQAMFQSPEKKSSCGGYFASFDSKSHGTMGTKTEYFAYFY